MSAQSLSHAVHHIAASPEITAVLREEVERVVAEDGWTKSAMGKMRKLDSFLRESQRYNGINISESISYPLHPSRVLVRI